MTFSSTTIQNFSILRVLITILAWGGFATAQTPAPTTSGTLSLIAVGQGGQPNTYSVTIQFQNVSPTNTLNSFRFGSASATGTPATAHLLTAQPTLGTIPNGWTAVVGGSSTYSINFTPASPLTANGAPITFTFTSASSIADFKTFSTNTRVAAHTFVTNTLVNSTVSSPTTATVLSNFTVTPPLPLKFVNGNKSSVVPPANIWVSFSTAYPDQFSAYYVHPGTGKVVTIGLSSAGMSTAVNLAQCQGVIYLGSINSGVVYLSMGTSGLSTSGTPSATGSPGINHLWTAGCEITYLGSASDSGDVTAINAFSFPISVQVEPKIGTGAYNQHAQFNIATDAMISGISALTSRPDLNTIFGTPPGAASLQLVRVLAPGNLSTPPTTAGPYPLDGWPSFSPYVASLQNAPKPTVIQNTVAPFTFTFKLTVDSSNTINLTGSYTDSGGKDPGAGITYTLKLPTDNPSAGTYPQSWFLYTSPNGLTGTPMTLTSTKDPTGSLFNTTVMQQLLHDLEVGFNLGFINSAALDPITKKPFGTETSAQWQANDAVANLKYAQLQPTHPYYNTYSAYIAQQTGGSVYGTAYADALPGVTLDAYEMVQAGTSNFVPVTGWTITVGAPPTTPTANQSIVLARPIPTQPAYTSSYTLPYYSSGNVPISWTILPAGKATLTANGTTSYTLKFTQFKGGNGTYTGTAGGTPTLLPAPTITGGFSVVPSVTGFGGTVTAKVGQTLIFNPTVTPSAGSTLLYQIAGGGGNGTLTGNKLKCTSAGTMLINLVVTNPASGQPGVTVVETVKIK